MLRIISGKIKKISWILASHAFLVILFLILFDIMTGAFLFYKYVVLVQAKQPVNIGHDMKFKYNTYQEILKEWQVKDQIFQESKDKKYSNPFDL